MKPVKRVLWVDDDEILNMIFTQIMKNYYGQVQYSSFTEARSALEYLAGCREDDFPDILFVDLKMPEIDGFEFLNRYCKSFYTSHPETMVYVLTSSIRTSEIEQAKQYTCVVDCLTKPLSIEKLGELLQ